jgi:hypothetical protein
MRISKTFWLILGIGISVIVVGVLIWVYFDQRGEQQRLENSLSDAQQTHSTLISQKGDLESQLTQSEIELAEAESLLDETKASFPESVESIEYGEALFDIADDCDLDITELTASEPSDQEVESVTYSITSFEIVVESESAGYSDKVIVNNMLDFIDTIATSEYFTDTTHFANATIELVNIQFPQGEEEGEPSATINLVIYGYQGE